MKLTSRTTEVLSFVQLPLLVQTCMGIEGCFSAVLVPTCWPSTRLANVRAANDWTSIVATVKLETLG